MYDHTIYLKTVEGHCTSTYHNGQNVPIHDRKSGQVVDSMHVSLTQVWSKQLPGKFLAR